MTSTGNRSRSVRLGNAAGHVSTLSQSGILYDLGFADTPDMYYPNAAGILIPDRNAGRAPLSAAHRLRLGEMERCF